MSDPTLEYAAERSQTERGFIRGSLGDIGCGRRSLSCTSASQFFYPPNPCRAVLAVAKPLEAQASRLFDQPVIGQPGHETGTCWLVAEKNYILIYDIFARRVRVLQLHAPRRWPRPAHAIKASLFCLSEIEALRAYTPTGSSKLH